MKIYIYEAKRTAIGKFKKGFKNTSCRELGAQLSKNIFESSLISPDKVDGVYMGNVLSAGLGQNISRQILIDANIPNDRCAISVNMVCGSGMKAINLGYNDIKLGNIHCALVGGIENMSMAPLLKDRFDENKDLVDHMIFDSLTDVFSNKHMGITAENVAEKYNITRKMQDDFAYNSQMKVQNAIKKNYYKNEIVPIKTDVDIIGQDEFPRSDTTIEKLNSLKPVFMENGTVTAGNASGINDGGAFMIIGDDTIDANPLVEIVDFAEAGCDPDYMGMGPYYAINKLLSKNKLNLNDVDLYEINEAFASQSIAVINELSKHHNIDKNLFSKRVNVNGGALALGHPVGASGARIVTSLIYEMKRRKVKLGIASLCIGGGMGIAMLIRNVGD